MKKYFGIIFSIIIIVFSVLFIVTPKEDFSENENRYLADFPTFNLDTLADGSFMTDFEKYVQDHFPFRKAFVSIKTNSELSMGKTENNNVYIADDGYLIEKNEYVDEKRLTRIASMFNQITKGTSYKTTVIIVPTSITLNSDLLPAFATEYSELDRINTIYSKLENCNKVELYEQLKKLNEQGIQTHYKLDHHWTTRAAYEAYTAFMNANNMEALDLTSFKEEVVTDSFYGTTYSKANLYNVKPDSITTYTNSNYTFKLTYAKTGKTTNSFYNTEYLDKKDKYAMFLDENQELVVIENETKTFGENLLVIKDSYANCFIPFIACNFKTTHVIDPRYYVGSITDYIKDNNITQVLILYNIHTLVTDQGVFNIK